MPRPKRTKVAPSGPVQRARNPPHDATTSATASKAPKPAFDDLYDVSDPEDRVAASVRHVKKGNGQGKASATTPVRESAVNVGTSRSRNRGDEVATETANAISNEIEDDDELDLSSSKSSPEIEVGRRERTTPAIARSAIKIGNFKRRPRQPSILGRRDAMERSSSIESDMAEDDGLTTVGKQNRTPAVRNKPSMAPSSIALPMDRTTTPAHGSALKLGNFKRRAREPSILGPGRKPLQSRPDYEDEDEDEDDFNPEDESTPLNLSKGPAMTSSSASGSNSRKRKLSAVQRPQSSPTHNRSPRPDGSEERIPATASVRDEDEEEESDAELSSSPLIAPIPSVEDLATPEPMSETMAPPMSSSPESSPSPDTALVRPVSRGRSRRPTRGKTPLPRTQDSPMSSPPSLTHSPNRPYITNKSKSKKVLPPPSAFSTAQLQALLPRRRRRGGIDPFDVPGSGDEHDITGLNSDDDELSHLNIRARRQPRTPAPTRKPTKAKPPLRSTAKRTYGARPDPTTSDKENQEEVDPDDSLAPLRDDDHSLEDSQELEARVGKELKLAARKFQEVDKWELEFEETTASSSSPKDAR
jgi:hypothetical protein